MSNMETAIGHLEAGDWEAAHRIVQEDESMVGCWAHGIVHLMEGDLANAGYWYRRAEREVPDPSALGTELAALKRHLDGG